MRRLLDLTFILAILAAIILTLTVGDRHAGGWQSERSLVWMNIREVATAMTRYCGENHLTSWPHSDGHALTNPAWVKPGRYSSLAQYRETRRRCWMAEDVSCAVRVFLLLVLPVALWCFWGLARWWTKVLLVVCLAGALFLLVDILANSIMRNSSPIYRLVRRAMFSSPQPVTNDFLDDFVFVQGARLHPSDVWVYERPDLRPRASAICIELTDGAGMYIPRAALAERLEKEKAARAGRKPTTLPAATQTGRQPMPLESPRPPR